MWVARTHPLETKLFNFMENFLKNQVKYLKKNQVQLIEPICKFEPPIKKPRGGVGWGYSDIFKNT